MRIAVYLLFASCLVSCVDRSADVPPPPQEAPAEAPIVSPAVAQEVGGDIRLVPLAGTGLKFAGAYRCTIGELQYYMRFFERGSAAFVGGTEKYTGQLASMLTIDVQSGWNQVHNCPVVQRNDSLFIRSVGLKGVINYSGDVRASGDTVRFLRSSEINGSRQIMAYVFVPDSQLVPKP